MKRGLKMIDKNGKLFGKINLIDLIIILILVALAIFAVLKFAVPSNTEGTATNVKLTLFCEETPEYVVDYIKEGEPVYDSKEGINIGSVESFESGDPIGYDSKETGIDMSEYRVARDGYNSVKIVVDATGVNGVNGVTVNGVLYGVGHTMTVYAGQAKLYLRVMGISVEPAA